MTTFLLRNAAVLDTANGEIAEGCDILIEDDLIREISPQPLHSPSARLLDLGGRIVTPGLIDAHVHVMAVTTNLAQLARIPPSLVTAQAKHLLEAMLVRGFTTVRDAGGADWGLAEAVRRNYFQGPRLFVSGLGLAQSGGMGDFRDRFESDIGCPCCRSLRSISRVADGVDDVRRAARDELRKGADQVKVFAGGGIAGGIPVDRNHFSPEELRAIVDEARAFDTYVMAHAYAPASIRRAVEAGVRTIEHGNLVDAETAAFMAPRAYMVPTLAVYESYHRHARELGVAPHRIDGIKDLLHIGQRALQICRDAGVRIGFGSDLEGMLHQYHLREFVLRSEVMTPREIIASATVVNAEILQMSGKLGVLRPGAFADLLVLEGNPLDDINVFQGEGRNISVIMKGGVIYKNSL